MKPARIAPSLLAADFGHLADAVGKVSAAADLLHLDVMDGHFVDNISFGLPVIAALRPLTELFFEAHLMITNPASYLTELADSGVERVIAHIEAAPDPTELAAAARAQGVEFGVALNPATPFAAVEPFLDECDVLLVMTVEPGRGGQEFLPEMLQKVAEARNSIDSAGFSTDIEVDGGINPETAGAARSAGADVFVAGTAVFAASDPAGAIAAMRRSIEVVT